MGWKAIALLWVCFEAGAATPSDGPARSIGAAASGCLAGAQSLAFDGDGYSVVRTTRERYYGHGALIDYIQQLGTRVAASGLGTLLVGDLSLARGGRMPYGHSSHQNGLDVDIWFHIAPKPPFSPLDALRDPGVQPSLLNPGKTGLSPSLWNGRQSRLLRLAAEAPTLDRIFVNPVIKRELCRSMPGGWLHKLRPWYGHDDHFHARLTCPTDSPACQPQAPPPPGDGCGSELDWWFQPHQPEHKPPAAPIRQPPECAALSAEKRIEE